MDRGRSSGGGGGSKGLVAGVKAALKPRSHSSVKSHSKSQPEEEDEDSHRQPNTDAAMSSSSSKSHRSPKSPFTGWKRSRSKEKSKKDATSSASKSKDAKVNRRNPSAGPCSRSQAERLSSHITDDYSSYGSDASEMLRDIQTGRYTSFTNHHHHHKETNESSGVNSRLSVTATCEQPLTVDHQWPKDSHGTDSNSKESEDPYSKDMDYCFANSRYVNLPASCFGVSCTGYSSSNFNADNQNSFESGANYGSVAVSGFDYSGMNPIETIVSDSGNICAGQVYEGKTDSEGNIYGGVRYNEGMSPGVHLWGGGGGGGRGGGGNGHHGNGLREEVPVLIEGVQGSSCSVRVQGDGSEAQDLESPEGIKVEEAIKVGGPSLALGRESWLKSALTYNIEVPEFPRNEVVVLALGIDQYIEEVFKYLDHSGDGKVHLEDFKALCSVLGLKDDQKEDSVASSKRCHCMGSNLTLNGSVNNSLMNAANSGDQGCPMHLTFSEFHDKLCESFIRGAKTESVVPLASRRSGNTKLVTSVVQVQRRYDVLDNIAKCLAEVSAGLDADENKMIAECPAASIICCKCQQSAIQQQQQQHIDKNSNIALQPVDSEYSFLQKQVLLQQQELQCLREVIEDMRVALQSSDAENLALQVKTLRSGGPSQGSSMQDLSLTDEEDTIDDLVKQLTALSRPARVNSEGQTAGNPVANVSISSSKSSQTEIEGPDNLEDPLNTAFLSGGEYSLERELQATYEALQAAREEREATQADLQKVVGDLQEREKDLRGAELNLKAAHTALEKVQYDNQALVMEIAETRGQLEETRQKLMDTTENLQQAREAILEKERILKDTHSKLNKIRNSREMVVDCVCSARNLVAGSLDQVRAGEQALNSLAAFSAYPIQHDLLLSNSKPNRLDAYCRADSGLYSEESEREEDRRTPERSLGQNSASEDDLWLPRKSKENLKESLRHNVPLGNDLSSSSCSPASPSSPASDYDNLAGQTRLTSPILITDLDEVTSAWPKAKRNKGLTSNSTEIIEGLERDLLHLQRTLNEAELEWKQENVCPPPNAAIAKDEDKLLEDKLEEVEAERMRLALVEDKLRQLLQVLLSVADLNLSRRTLGRLVLEAVEETAGIKIGDINFGIPTREVGKVSPLTFLSNLLSSTSNYQALSTESLLQLAFQGLSFPPCIPELAEPIEATLG